MTSTLPLLRADCSQCAGLCCVALSLTKSADFPVDKPAGDPCEHLETDFRCDIHPRLIESGYRGCVAFDCLGAGQRATQIAARGIDWRGGPEQARHVFDAFATLRALHELLWLLDASAQLVDDRTLHSRIAAELDRVAELSALPGSDLANVDVAGERALTGEVLQSASLHIRTRASQALGLPQPSSHFEHLDLAGDDLRTRELRTASMRGALLMACSLSGADLTATDLLGADLRDADLRGAHLADSLFLMQPQLNAAIGDERTRIPANLTRPSHWRN